jgi:hypothetical protein
LCLTGGSVHRLSIMSDLLNQIACKVTSGAFLGACDKGVGTTEGVSGVTFLYVDGFYIVT